MAFITTAGDVSLLVPSGAVQVAASDEAFVLLIDVSGEYPVWLGLARNIGQSVKTGAAARAAMARAGVGRRTGRAAHGQRPGQRGASRHRGQRRPGLN